jgi:hypothetical protein
MPRPWVWAARARVTAQRVHVGSKEADRYANAHLRWFGLNRRFLRQGALSRFLHKHDF